MRRSMGLIVSIILEDRIAYGDAFVTDVSSGVIVGGGDQLTDYVLTFMAKRTTQRVVGTSTFHAESPDTKNLHCTKIGRTLQPQYNRRHLRVPWKTPLFAGGGRPATGKGTGLSSGVTRVYQNAGQDTSGSSKSFHIRRLAFRKPLDWVRFGIFIQRGATTPGT